MMHQNFRQIYRGTSAEQRDNPFDELKVLVYPVVTALNTAQSSNSRCVGFLPDSAYCGERLAGVHYFVRIKIVAITVSRLEDLKL